MKTKQINEVICMNKGLLVAKYDNIASKYFYFHILFKASIKLKKYFIKCISFGCHVEFKNR